MATGVPLAASGTTALGEVVADGGVTFDPLDVDAIARALLHLATSEEARRALSRQGLRRAAAFSWAASARTHLAVYRDAASGASTALDTAPDTASGAFAGTAAVTGAVTAAATSSASDTHA
jgi:hypothetical protein